MEELRLGKYFKFLILVSCFIFMFPLTSFAHPGRTDSSGGHTCRTNCPSWGYNYGEYHYHNNPIRNDYSYSYTSTNGWVNSYGSWYYYQYGSYSTYWENINSKWYYFDYDGVMRTGWIWDYGTWYYLDLSGAMMTGWINQGGTWYFLSNTGAMATGWVKDQSKWYSLTESGAMRTGWFYDYGDWYYFDISGAMLSGWQLIGENWYYFYPSGEMAYNGAIDGYILGENGAMIN